MEKVTYVVWGPAADGSDRYRDLFVGELAPELLDRGVAGLSIDVDDARSDVASPVPTPPGEDPHVAVVSVWLSCHDRRGPIEEVLATTGLRTAGYLVSDAVYTEYGDNEWGRARDWAAGEPSPSVLTVCLIHRPAGAEPAAWYRHWHGVQSPVSAELQPRCRYVRNEVVRPLTDGAPEVHGIVEEAWPSATHITDPMLFFRGDGDPARLQANIERMIDSVGAFIDMDRLRNVTMSEHLWP